MGGRKLDIIISNSSGKPIYEQIASQIKSLIISGRLKEGESFRSIRLLAKELRISVITTKRAYEDLERDGFIETVPGKGSFCGSQKRGICTRRTYAAGEAPCAKQYAGPKQGVSLPENSRNSSTFYSITRRKAGKAEGL